MSRIIKNPKDVKVAVGTAYPAPHDAICSKREKYRLGNATGLTNYGVNYVVLPAGQASAQRHWHKVQDEFVWVLDGELVLVTDAGEELMTPGMSAGFPAGELDGHHLVNRTDKPASYLEIGDRLPGDSGSYSDIDMKFEFDTEGKPHFFHKDGAAY